MAVSIWLSSSLDLLDVGIASSVSAASRETSQITNIHLKFHKNAAEKELKARLQELVSEMHSQWNRDTIISNHDDFRRVVEEHKRLKHERDYICYCLSHFRCKNKC